MCRKNFSNNCEKIKIKLCVAFIGKIYVKGYFNIFKNAKKCKTALLFL